VTIQDIVDKVGMTKGAFYYFFTSKEQLFQEITDHFIFSSMKIDYALFSHDSLYQFYHDYIAYTDNSRLSILQNETNNGFNLNFYTLIFDALKIIPGFQEKMVEYMQAELTAWTEVVQAARNRGEIRSSMNDEQIASLFIYISDGAGMKSKMEGGFKNSIQRILTLWDAFYEDLRA
jgi:AcrR family transcriptional regulator